MFRSQSAMLADDQDRIMVDFVGRFERLDADWQHVACRLGGPARALPHVNSSAYGPYRDYYSVRTREIVDRHFAADIRNFGNVFGRETGRQRLPSSWLRGSILEAAARTISSCCDAPLRADRSS
jgi:hypothetical protein